MGEQSKKLFVARVFPFSVSLVFTGSTLEDLESSRFFHS